MTQNHHPTELDAPTSPLPARSPLPPWELRLLLSGGLLVLLYLCGLIGMAFFPILIRDHPALLILLHPISGTLVLTAPKFAPLPFIVLAVGRRLLAHGPAYLLGRWYGHYALEWLTSYLGVSERMVRLGQQLFTRFGWIVVLISPSSATNILAGTAKIPWPLFVVLDLLGTIGNVILVYYTATAAAGPLTQLLRLIEDNAGWLTIGTVFLTILVVIGRSKRLR